MAQHISNGQFVNIFEYLGWKFYPNISIMYLIFKTNCESYPAYLFSCIFLLGSFLFTFATVFTAAISNFFYSPSYGCFLPNKPKSNHKYCKVEPLITYFLSDSSSDDEELFDFSEPLSFSDPELSRALRF